MQDRFKFRATVKGYYYIDTPEKCEESEPLIFLENIDVLDIGDIGISEEDLEIAIRKQYPDLQDVYIECILENFRDNSNGIDTYITITPERVYQSTGLKDKNGKLIYEGDILKPFENGVIAVSVQWRDSYVGFCMYFYYRNSKGVIYRETETFDDFNPDLFEVIGNIYENPELIKE